MTERERVRQHFLDLPKTHRWPSASERPGNWYVRLDDAVAAVLAATPSVEPPFGPDNPAPGTRLWRLRNHPETLTLEDAIAVARDLLDLPTQASDSPEKP